MFYRENFILQEAMPEISNILKKYSRIKILLSLLTVELLFILVVFPHYENKINNIAETNVKILDVRFSYNIEQAKNLFNEMGPRGREVYYVVVSKVDMVYPIVYSLLLILLTALLLKHILINESKIIYISLLPLLGMIFDYLENLNTLRLLRNFPQLYSSEVNFGSLMTQIKWTFIGLSILTILVLSLMVFINKLKKFKESKVKRQRG